MDKYTQFTFNGVHSSAYNLFYTNDGGLSYPFSPSFTQNVVRPMYQGRSYYLGTDVGENVYKFTFAAEKLTNAERRAIFDWLDIGKPGYIKFDAFPNYKQKVVITNIGEGTIYPREWKNGLIENIVEFSVEMQTVGNPYPQTDTFALANRDAKGNIIEDLDGAIIKDPETRLPVAEIVTSSDPNRICSFRIYNWTSINQYFSLVSSAQNNLEVKSSLDDKILYSIEKTGAFTLDIDGETGIGRLSSSGDALAETVSGVEVTSDGPLLVPNNIVYNGRVKLDLTTDHLDDYVNTIGGLLKSNWSFPLQIAILPLQKETVHTSAVEGGSVGVYPSTKSDTGGEDILHEPVSIYVRDDDALSTLSINRVTYPWITNGEDYYHVIITQPSLITVTGGAGSVLAATLKMSYRNRL